jgi:hypothetical protein
LLQKWGLHARNQAAGTAILRPNGYLRRRRECVQSGRLDGWSRGGNNGFMPASPTVAQTPPLGTAAPRGRPRRAPRTDPLVREIAVVLAVKLTALLLLWFAFFRPGDTPRPAPTAQAVEQHIAAPATPSEVPVVAH